MKNLKLAIYLTSIVVLLWISISFCNVVAHNNPADGTYEYPSWNFFTMLERN